MPRRVGIIDDANPDVPLFRRRLVFLYVVSAERLEFFQDVRDVQNRNDVVMLVEYDSLQNREILERLRERLYDLSTGSILEF